MQVSFCNVLCSTVLGGATLLLALGCSSDDQTDPGPTSGRFEALTYNVAGLPQGISSSNPERNMPMISPLLNNYGVVLVQEDFSYHYLLEEHAEHRYQSTPKEHFQMLVHDGLNRFSDFKFFEHERVRWVQCYGDASTGASDCMAEKGFTFAITELAPGVRLHVYNHHGEAGNGPEDDLARQAGYDQFIAFIKERSAGAAVIVAGDTNLHRDDPEDLPVLEKFIQEADLQDVCEYLGCGVDKIDRFFFRSSEGVEIEPTTWRIADEFVDEGGGPLSDHEAIHVSFEWRRR